MPFQLWCECGSGLQSSLNNAGCCEHADETSGSVKIRILSVAEQLLTPKQVRYLSKWNNPLTPDVQTRQYFFACVLFSSTINNWDYIASIVGRRVRMERWWNGIDREKLKHWDLNCHFVLFFK